MPQCTSRRRTRTAHESKKLHTNSPGAHPTAGPLGVCLLGSLFLLAPHDGGSLSSPALQPFPLRRSQTSTQQFTPPRNLPTPARTTACTVPTLTRSGRQTLNRVGHLGCQGTHILFPFRFSVDANLVTE